MLFRSLGVVVDTQLEHIARGEGMRSAGERLGDLGAVGHVTDGGDAVAPAGDRGEQRCGIGAGPQCHGQVLVLHDMIGVSPGRRPRFVRNFIPETGTVEGAVKAYVAAVKDGSFPAQEHGY